MSTGVVGPSSPTATSPPGPPVTDEVVSSSSSFAPATVPVPPPPSDSFVGGDFLFEDILNLQPILGINSFSAPRYDTIRETCVDRHVPETVRVAFMHGVKIGGNVRACKNSNAYNV